MIFLHLSDLLTPFRPPSKDPLSLLQHAQTMVDVSLS